MNGGSSIIGIRGDVQSEAQRATIASALGFEEDLAALDHDERWVRPSAWRTAVPVALTVLAACAIASLIWFARDQLATMSPLALGQFAATLCVFPLLAGVVWLVTLRTSTAEAQRFGATARSMRAEAASLEHTVAGLAAAIEANRTQLAEQVRALTALGDSASDRLASIGRNLSEEIDQADVHARSLSMAAQGAHAELQVLLRTMPRATSEIEALTGVLDRTGIAAGEQAAALDAQIAAIADRGREAETVAGGAAQKLAAHIARMEATSETAGSRLESVTAEMATAVDALLDRTAQAVDESRKGIAAQGDAMLAMVGANQAALDSSARESAEALAERIGIIDVVIDRIAQRLDAQRGATEGLVETLEGGIGQAQERLDALHASGVERSQVLAASISALGSSADAMTNSLQSGDTLARQAIGTAETLLLALEAAAREIDETLPVAMDRLDQRIGTTRNVIGATKPELLSLVTAAESTHDAVEAIAQVIGDQRRSADQLSNALLTSLTDGREKAEGLSAMVDETIGQTNRLAEEAAPRLIDALLRVRETAAAAAERARDTLATVIPEAAEALEAASVDALRRASAVGIEPQLAAIAEVAEAAAAAADGAAQRLDHQIRAIADATALVDNQIVAARAEREEHDRESFGRKASLLIEAMNSAAIDITKAFGPEVSDSAWTAYLKGDRGVFTRRAVRLLDGAEQRDIHQLYDEDPGFRDQVNRYIHDFEAMLRTILTQREGAPLSITLLSSDMGKLYVALAQAIERLR